MIFAKLKVEKIDIEARLKEKNIILPSLPTPVGNYVLYKKAGKMVYISQIPWENNQVLKKGQVGRDLTQEQAQEAAYLTLLNILSILKDAAGGNLNNVKQAVHLFGFFNVPEGYDTHAQLLNPASDALVEFFGEKGLHNRATIGVSSLPLNAVVEINAVFELN